MGLCSASRGQRRRTLFAQERGLLGARKQGPRHPGWQGKRLGRVRFRSGRVRGELGFGLEQVLNAHEARIEGASSSSGLGTLLLEAGRRGRGGTNSQ